MATLIANPKTEISTELLNKLKEQIHEQGQVVIHCIHKTDFPSYIRIWPTTFLFDQHSDHISKLVHAENISYFPQWKPIASGENHFTLIFTGLTRSCLVFDLLEQCENQDGAFRVNSITRNDSDVYYVEI